MKTISLDAMGGDHGLETVVPAAIKALKEYPDLKLILVGQTDVIQTSLLKYKASISDRLAIHHASESVEMNESPATALRGKKDSSMRVAINLVKDGVAQACVSAGNTGALMATARFVLKTLPGIDRPAIIRSLPTKTDKQTYVLDLGANVDSTADHLNQFAVMGTSLVEAIENIKNPTVALLNIGEEDIKGNEQVKKAAELLANNGSINYIGYVEGNDLFSGKVDVVVCDGFVGNAVLKSVEGIAKLVMHYAKAEFFRNWLTKLSALCVFPVLRRLRGHLDPRRHNGAILLGLNGIVIKSHGGADSLAFYNAIEEAVLEVDKNVPEQIRQKVTSALNEAKE